MDGKLVRELHEKAQLAGNIGAHRLGGGWDGLMTMKWHKIIGAGKLIQ